MCGLVHFLQSCTSSSIVKYPFAKSNFTSFFCDDEDSPSGACLHMTSLPDDVISAYFEALNDFVLSHLLGVIYDYLVTQRRQGLVVTRTQRELAVGYYVTDFDQSVVHVQGVLQEDWLTTSTKRGALWRVTTCLEERSMDNNMKVRGKSLSIILLVTNPNVCWECIVFSLECLYLSFFLSYWFPFCLFYTVDIWILTFFCCVRCCVAGLNLAFRLVRLQESTSVSA
jgi:hypothetical protein